MSLRNLIRQAGNALAGPDAIERWIDAGRPSPPPAEMKARNVVVLAELFGLRTFVETGTYTGDMLAAVAAHFDRLYSIELDKRLASAAVAKFAGNQKITVFQGESADRLSALLPTLPAACCFWLDAHCSGAGTALGRNYTPIVEELNILARRAGGETVAEGYDNGSCVALLLCCGRGTFGRLAAAPAPT